MKPISVENISIRTELRPGDIGYIIHLHGDLYAREYNYGIEFETYVAEGLIEFFRQPSDNRGKVWIAEHNSLIVGSLVLLDRGDIAQLRYFLIRPEYRGIGLGKELMNRYLQSLISDGFKKSYLWTTDELGTAASLYTQAGFKLTDGKKSMAFGKPVFEQRYDLTLDS